MKAEELSPEELRHLKRVSKPRCGENESMCADSVNTFQDNFGLSAEEMSKALELAEAMPF